MSMDKGMTPESRLRGGRFAGIVGIGVNLILFAAKVVVGIISGSVSVIADAVNNLSDAMTSVFVLVGYILAGKPADKEHPFGHARMEYLFGLFISVIITVLGVEMLRSAWNSFTSDTKVSTYSAITIGIMAVTALVKVGLALFFRHMGKKIDSQSLKASAVDSLGDVVATTAVILGLVLTPYLGTKTDSVLGGVIGIYIIILGIKLTMESSDVLLGKAPDTDLTDSIVSNIKKYDNILGIHDLVIHSYGAGKFFATIHVEVDSAMDPMVSHDLIDNIEADFLRNHNISLVIHMDPVCLSDPETNKLREIVAQIILDLSEEAGSSISMHDFRVVWGVTHTNLIFDVAVSDDMPLSDINLSSRITDKIKAVNESYNAVICVDRDYHSERFGNERR